MVFLRRPSPRRAPSPVIVFLAVLWLLHPSSPRSAAYCGEPPEPTLADVEALFFEVDELEGQEKADKVASVLRLRSPLAVPFLLRLLTDREDFALIRDQMIANIYLCADDTLIGEFDSLLSLNEALISKTAVRALGYVHTPQSQRALMELTSHADGVVRCQAYAALGELSEAEVARFLSGRLTSGALLPAEWSAASYSRSRIGKALAEQTPFVAATVYERQRVAAISEKGPPGWMRPSEWHLVGQGFGGSVGGSEWQLAPVNIGPKTLGGGLKPLLRDCPLLAVMPLSDEFAKAFFGSSGNAAALADFLASGGCIVFTDGSLSRPVARWLESVGVPVPRPSDEKTGPLCAVSAEDFHPVVEFPFDLANEKAELSFSGTWQHWDRAKQIAPLRSSAKPENAALIIQPRVRGKGTVILSRVRGYPGQYQCRHNLLASCIDHQKVWAERSLWDVSDEIVTPHVKWARPHRSGALRALFLLPREAQREMIEIAQRLEMVYDYVPLHDALNGSHQIRWGPWAFIKKPRDRLDLSAPTRLVLEHYLARPYDVIVVGNYTGVIPSQLKHSVEWRLLPPLYRTRLLSRVKRGTGLVFIGAAGRVEPNEDSLALTSAPAPPWMLSALPSGDRSYRDAVGCYEFGRGRFASVRMNVHARFANDFSLGPDYRTPGTEEPWTRINEKEYPYSLICKALLWAARKEGAAHITQGVASPDGDLLKVEIKCTEPLSEELTLSAQLRDAYGQVVSEIQEKGQLPTASLRLPALPAGAYVAEITLRDARGRSLDWASVQFRRRSELALATIKSDKEFYRPGEIAKATVQLTRPAPEQAVCRVRVRDVLKRLVFQAQAAVSRGEQELHFEIPIERPLRRLWYARFELTVAGKVVSYQQVPLLIDLPPDPLDYAWQVVKYDDFRSADEVRPDQVPFSRSPLQIEQALAANARFHIGWAYMGSLIGSPTTFPASGVRSPCLSSPTFERSIRHHLARVIPPLAKYGVRSFELQDETSFGGYYCFSEHCLHRFRRWLREQYGSLEALNRNWQSSFGKWPDVRPLTLEEAAKQDRFASWMDHRTFMESAVAGWVELCQNVVREHIPGAKVGLSGTYGYAPGSFDWWKLSRVCKVIVKYGGCVGRDFHASFRQRDTNLGNWDRCAYDLTDYQESYCRYSPWQNLFHGQNVFYFWGGYICVRSDLRPFNAVRWCAETVNEIKDGLDRFLLAAKRDDFGLAVHYSQNSIQYQACLRRKAGEALNVSYSPQSYLRLAREAGLGMRYVSYEEVELGELVRQKCKLFFLPGSFALSDAEVTALIEFVENGGVLVADHVPGIVNESGVPRKQNPLADLFGVSFADGTDKLRTALLGAKPEFMASGSSWEVSGYDASARLKGGQAMARIGQSPALVLNTRGRGKTLYLNFNPAKIEVAASQDKELAAGAQRAMFRRIVQEAGVIPVATVTNPDGSYFPHDQALFRIGDNLMFGFGTVGEYGLMKHQAPVDVTVHFAAKHHVYDGRRRKYLGLLSRREVKLTPSFAELYALLPYRVQSIQASAHDAALGGVVAIRAAVTTDGAPPGAHVFVAEVTDAAGRPRPAYRLEALASNGQAEAQFPLALDDPVGRWRATVRDVATGVTAEIEFDVSQPK